MVRSHVLFFAAAALAATGLPAHAGDQDVSSGPRREFHLSSTYPFIFRPDNYLTNQGPVPMRYGNPAIDPFHRQAPGLSGDAKGPDPKAAKEAAAKKEAEKAAGAPQPTPVAQVTPEPSSTEDKQVVSSVPVDNSAPSVSSTPAPQSAPAEYPVPDNAPQQQPRGNADFTQAPDEVSGYFRNPYNFVPNSHRFFDPIFEPAQPAPTQAQMGPKSSATYVEKP
jgi:hypothetical protein